MRRIIGVEGAGRVGEMTGRVVEVTGRVVEVTSRIVEGGCRPRRGSRAKAAALGVLGSCLCSQLAFGAIALASGRSQTLRVRDRAHLHLISANGNTLVEAGHATGNLPGNVRVSLTLRSHTATSTFTLSVRGGSIGGHGSGALKIGKKGWDSFGGKLIVSDGGGRFRGAHGQGGIYGAVYRVTDAMNVQVYGTLRY